MGFEIIRTGHSRTVILTKRLVFKFPNCQTWRTFLKGWLGNGQEAELWSMRHPLMCPVLFSFLGGLVIVMPRARQLTRQEFFNMDLEALDLEGVPAEKKMDSWGMLDG